MSNLGARVARERADKTVPVAPEATISAWAVKHTGNGNVTLERLRIPLSAVEAYRAQPPLVNSKGIVAARIEQELFSDKFSVGDPWK